MSGEKVKATAFLWDGKKQLPGMLVISDQYVAFNSLYFRDSHLQLRIRITDIDHLALKPIFRISTHILRIKSRVGKTDQFVLENPRAIKKLIENKILKSQGF